MGYYSLQETADEQGRTSLSLREGVQRWWRAGAGPGGVTVGYSTDDP